MRVPLQMKTLWMGCAAVALAGCGEGPAEPRQERQAEQLLEPSGGLANVYTTPFPYHALGSFAVNASTDSVTATSGSPVRVRVRTSGGDDEQIELVKVEATLPRQLLVVMRDGEHVAELRARMNAEQLRFGSFGITGEHGLLHVVGGDPAAALARVRGWPGVRGVQPNALISVGGKRVWTMMGALPMDEAAPAPGSGTLEVRPSEIVTVEYRTANGAPATIEWTYRSRSEPDIRAFVPLAVARVQATLYGDGPRPPLLIDAESFATASWHASGTRVSAATAVSGLPAGFTVVNPPRGARCRGSVVPRDCSDVAQGTFLYTAGMYRGAGTYEMGVFFRAPSTPPGCVRQQFFRFRWIGGAWQVDAPNPASGC
ncbi:MAG TPA: hypothetical protein VHG93_01660 [Longimicrobium sp.]|nr:hypothetical protein [Longimicrobium sp.]